MTGRSAGRLFAAAATLLSLIPPMQQPANAQAAPPPVHPTAGWPSVEMPPLVLRDTRRDEWPELRSRVQARLKQYLGERPAAAAEEGLPFEETGRDTVAGLTRVHYRYQVLPGDWATASLILPQGFPPDPADGRRRPAVLAIHGTHDRGREVVMDERNAPARAYAVELARRGYVAFAPDLFGYGDRRDGAARQKIYDEFDAKNPGWSQADRTVLGLQRALDVLDRLPFVRGQDGYAAIGNSLGGGYTLRLMAADERVKVGVASTGVSPQSTNIYRLVNKQKGARLRADEVINRTGRAPYEVTDLLALCAPRALLVVEPFDDPYNPDVGATFAAVRNAWMVWSLLGAPQRVSLHIHGDGHTTTDGVRAAAYDWIQRWLPVGVEEQPQPKE